MHQLQEQSQVNKDDKQIRSVFVGNIPYEANDEQLRNIFSKIGPVTSFRIVYDRETGKPKGYGFCEYRDVETAQSAIRNLNGMELHNRTLRVDSAVNEKGKEETKEIKPQEIPTWGPSVPGELASESITKIMASMPPEQIYELLKQTKACIQNNPEESREMLILNPQLAFALLQALLILKLIDSKVVNELIINQQKGESVYNRPGIATNQDFVPLHENVPRQHTNMERPKDFYSIKSYHRDSPKYFQNKNNYRIDNKRSSKLPHPSEIDDYYQETNDRDFSSQAQIPVRTSPKLQDYPYSERERSFRSRYADSYEEYTNEPAFYSDLRTDPRMNFRREREKNSPREARSYEIRELRQTSKSISLPNDPRLTPHPKHGIQFEDHSMERRDRECQSVHQPQ
ncbi:hypothetical protein HZS_3674, partial [Henneguya salminicola]